MLICVLGLPGSGKSTLAKRLEKRMQALGTAGGERVVSYLHPGRYAFAMGWVPQYASRETLAAVPHLTGSFLRLVEEALGKGDVVTDGFPRTVEQTRLLLQKNFEVVIVNLVFPQGRAVELSIARQEKRIKDDGVTVPLSEVEEQTTFALEHDLRAANELMASGLPTISVDAMLSEQEVEDEVVKALQAMNGGADEHRS